MKKSSNKENSKASTSKLINDKIKSALSSNKETVIEINKYYDLIVESKVKTKDSKDGYSRVAFLMKKDNNEENTAEEVPYSGVINLDSEESFIKEVKEKINKYVKKGTKKINTVCLIVNCVFGNPLILRLTDFLFNSFLDI